MSQFLLTFFLIFSCFAQELLGTIQEVPIRELELKDCLLPEDHPLQNQLQFLFQDPHLFASLHHLEQSEFHLLSRNNSKIMVASHPAIKHYLIKKFSDIIPQHLQLINYVKRIRGARALKEFIYLNRLKHIVVPQKWIYPLPTQFSNPQTGERSYLLIVEDMEICSGKGQVKGQTAKRYNKIDKKTLRELCMVVYYFRGLDSGLCNMPFTHHNQIAFIDTECWDDWNREGFLSRVMPYLPQKRQKYALKVLRELCEQDTKPICKQCLSQYRERR